MRKFHKIADFIFLYLNIIVVFLLPLNGQVLPFFDPALKNNLLPIPFILFVLFSFFTSGFSFKIALNNWFFRALILLFLGYAFSAFLSSPPEIAWKSIEIKLSFLTIPLVVFSNVEFYQKRKNLLFVSLLMGIVFALVLFDYRAFFVYQTTGEVLLYVKYTMMIHPTYFGAIVLIGIVFLMDYFFKIPFNWFKTIIVSFIVWFLFVHLFLILSKAVILVAVIVVLIFLGLNIAKQGIKISLFFSTLLVPILFFLFQNDLRNLLVDSVKVRFTDLVQLEATDGSTSFRYNVLMKSPDIIGKNWMFGVGSGKEIQHLENYYTQNNWAIPLQHKYNTHNQFFQTWLSIGVLGFILLSSLLIVPLFLKFGIGEKLSLLSFVFLFFTEAMLERQFGIVFFTLIYSVMMVNFSIKKPIKTPSKR